MDKEELLQELSAKIYTGEISREEIVNRFVLAQTAQNEVKMENLKDTPFFSITKMLYVLGIAIVIIGIIIFISQIWYDLGSFGRIIITLGLGFLFAAIGSLLLKNKPDENIGAIFHFIGGVLIPGGSLVTLSELSTGSDSLWPLAFTFGIIFIFYLLLNSVHKNAILTFFAIINGTAFVYFLFDAITNASLYSEDLYAYLTMIMGLSYLLLAHTFRNGWNEKLIRILYFFGALGFFGAAFSQVFDSVLWQIFYFILVIGGLFLSIYMKSRSILIISTLFLIAHVSYITSEYFANSLGWPISLVILGLIFIGLGYISININRKYIAN
ncbi:MAG: DUF2157 domain-containing protein [Candidatus Moraniibacteriota bacterium]|nr:MAG: DUF2157 domain-containing protein [Candidatus Moranbacteria bacterium]